MPPAAVSQAGSYSVMAPFAAGGYYLLRHPATTSADEDEVPVVR